MPSPDYDGLVVFLRSWCAKFGVPPTEVRLTLADGKKLRLVIPLPMAAESGPPQVDVPLFVPTDLQNAIMDALAGKALRTDALAARCDCDRRTLFKPGGLKELQDQGEVAHHSRIGFYRPDDPPEEVPAGAATNGHRRGTDSARPAKP